MDNELAQVEAAKTVHQHDCIFCRINAGEIPAHVVYEDEQLKAFSGHSSHQAGTRAHHPEVSL